MRVTEFFKKQIAIGLAALCATSMPSVVTADDCCWDYDCNSFCDWEWYVGAQYLYWKPCVNDLDYASYTVEGGSVFATLQDIRRICPEWESGYRIYAGGSPREGLGIFGSFTQVKADGYDEIPGTNNTVFPLKGLPILNQIAGTELGIDGTFIGAAAYWDSNYRDWFVGATYNMEINSCSSLSPYFGIVGLHYDEEFGSEFYSLVDEEEEVLSVFSDYAIDIKGLGFRLGSYYHSTICDCFGLYANINGSLLVGDYDSTSEFGFANAGETEFIVTNKFNDDGCCFLVPGWQFGFGLTYDTCICNVDLILKIGYEFNAWFNLPSYRFFTEGVTEFISEGEGEEPEIVFTNIATSSVNTSRSLGYHGLTAGIALKF